MMFHSMDTLLFLGVICLYSVAVVPPWVTAANGMGELIQAFYFGLGLVFDFVFLEEP